MTEGYEDGNYLVRVRAQVMMRDDSTGGWLPMGGGGLSNVSVRKRALNPPPAAPSEPLQNEYLIFGKRISDQSVVLSCTIKKDFEYNKVMPTFHHWKTGDRKFGLTFQTAADARAFDKGVRTAVEELLEVPRFRRGGAECKSGVLTAGHAGAPLAAGPSRHLLLLQQQQFQFQYRAADLLAWPMTSYPAPFMGMEGLAGSSPLQKYNADVGDDDVFMTLNLPVERGDSRSSSDSSTRGGGSRHPTPPSEQPQQFTHPHATNHHLHRINYISRHPYSPPSTGNGSDSEKPSGTGSDTWARTEGKGSSPDKDRQTGGGPMGTDNYSYVQLTAVHDYTYPIVDEHKGVMAMRRESSGSLKKLGVSASLQEPLSSQQPPLPVKTSGRKKSGYTLPGSTHRARCRFCQEVFSLEHNRRGACEFAPDKVRNVIEQVSCMECAQCMMYHCMADAEGDYAQRPCQCGLPGEEGCAKRWFGLGLLTMLVPCLWLYPPLRACHWCCIKCGACGGRHVPAEH